VAEEWKWRGTPVWSHYGLICTGETYKNVVKMTFAKGASLKDPSGLFNSSLEGNARRAIDFHEPGAAGPAESREPLRRQVHLPLDHVEPDIVLVDGYRHHEAAQLAPSGPGSSHGHGAVPHRCEDLASSQWRITASRS
jgi:Domain of unknown function (DU1801)